MSCPVSSYCMYYKNPPVCHNYPNIICGGPTPPTQKMYSCNGTQCIEDPNGKFSTCSEANCNPQPPLPGQCPLNDYCMTYKDPPVCHSYPNIPCGNPAPPPSKTVFCCDNNQCSQAQNACPSNLRPVDDCSTCTAPKVYVKCCDPSNGNCTTVENSCPAGLNQVDDCSSCVSPFIPPTTVVNCCNPSLYKCGPFPFACPQGWNEVADCSTCPKPPATISCCNSTSGDCKDNVVGLCPAGYSPISSCGSCKKLVNCCLNGVCSPNVPAPCPAGATQVLDCSQCIKPPPPSGNCPNLSGSGVPMVFWAEHPPVGASNTSPDVINYFTLMNQFLCQSNPVGIYPSKLMLRLETPVEPDGTRNCFYPSLSSPIYTQFLKNLPDNFELYAIPYFDKFTSWAPYPDTPQGHADMGQLEFLACNSPCSVTPCGSACPAGYSCVNGDCYAPGNDCGTCAPQQSCFHKAGKYSLCLTPCNGMCAAGTVNPDGSPGFCCSGATTENQLAKAVYQVVQWNKILGRPLFKGLVVDHEGSGYSRATIASKMREACRYFGVNLLLGTTYDGSNIGACIADLTAIDDTRLDFAMPEVYNLTTRCNDNGANPWPKGTQLVDSYDKAPAIGGCTAMPYPSTQSLYAQAWGTPSPSQTLWSGGNSGVNFGNIIKYGWKKPVPQDVANRIYPLLSVETSAASGLQTCKYTQGGSGGPCGIPNAFGVWNTVQGAQEFIKFVQLFQSSLSDIFAPGSGVIPLQNFGIFSFPLMPSSWFGQ